MEKVSLNLAETTIKMLGDRWKVQIIESLMDGTKTFWRTEKGTGQHHAESTDVQPAYA